MFEKVVNANGLLQLLPEADRRDLLGGGEIANLVKGHNLAAVGDPIAACWFPLSGLISILATDGDGNEAEVGMIGREGMANWEGAIYATRISEVRLVVQIAGRAVRLDAAIVREAMSRSPKLAHVILSYSCALSQQCSANSLAYARYSIIKRISRWLLMCADRVGLDGIELTHEALSVMLGVRRAGVTTALGELEKAAAIVTKRARIRIIDRAALLKIVGSGYGAPEAAYRDVLGRG